MEGPASLPPTHLEPPKRTQHDVDAHASLPILPHCVSISNVLFLFAIHRFLHS